MSTAINTAILSAVISAQITLRSAAAEARARLDSADERGEGIISMALAVLIMAALAAGMWVAYKAMMDDSNNTMKDRINEIGKK